MSSLYQLDYSQVVGNLESVADDKLSRGRRSVQNSFNAVFVTSGWLLWFVSFVWLNKTN